VIINMLPESKVNCLGINENIERPSKGKEN
jgi:hypothetical protein